MQTILSPGLRAAADGIRRAVLSPWGTAAAMVLLLGFAAVPVIHDPWNHDAAWLLYMAGAVLDGATPYVDIVDNNPPLIVFLSMPAVLLARLSGIAANDAWQLLLTVAGAMGLAIVARELRRQGEKGPDRRLLLLAAAFAVFALPKGSFGEREHLALILVLPYVVTAAGVLRSGPAASGMRGVRGPGWDAGIGVVAGVGIALKPFFVPAWLAVEAVLAYRCGWRTALRPASLALAFTGVLYLATIPVLTPAYLDVARVAQATYLGDRAAVLLLLANYGALTVLLATAVFLLARAPRHPLHVVTFAAAAGFTIGAWIQGKAFYYHFLPGTGMALVSIAAALMASRRSAAPVLTIAAVAGGVLWAAQDAAQSLAGRRAAEHAYLAYMTAAIETHTAERRFVVLGTWLLSAFPLTNHADAEWGMRHNGFWFLRPDRQGGETPMEAELRREVVDDLVASRPELIVLELPIDPGNWRENYVAYLSADPRFVELLADYEWVEDYNGCRLLRRTDGAALAQTLPPVTAVDMRCGPDYGWRARRAENG